MLKQLAKIANKLDAIGMTKEADVIDRLIKKTASENLEVDDLSGEGYYKHVPTLLLEEEPNLDREELKYKFLNHASQHMCEDIKVYEDTVKLKWIPGSETEYNTPHYLLSFKYVCTPKISGEKFFREEAEVAFWTVNEEGYPSDYLVSVQDEEGNDFHFYSEY